jgi:hypothetical protein
MNRYGNWRGYEGGRWVKEFDLEPAFAGSQYGTQSTEMPEAARKWLNEFTPNNEQVAK